MNTTEEIAENEIEAKVTFVSNTLGTTINDVLLAVVLPLLSYINYTLLFHTFVARNWKEKLLEFTSSNVLLVLPFILGLTILSDHLLVIDIVLLSLLAVILLWKMTNRMTLFKRCIGHLDDDTTYIYNYKAIIQVTTCFCILAVDFNVFPRRFAKAEVYGIGCMDLGVGTFIVSMALTSSPARGRQRIVLNYIFKSVTSSLALVLLGSARVVVVKLSNYQEHVSEYGTHWNFFITLAAVRITSVVILYLMPWFRRQFGYLLLSVIFIVAYQFALSSGGLEEIFKYGFAGDNSRSTFFDANREGMISCIGYLGLYYFGMFIGSQLFKMRLTPLNKISWLLLWFLASYVGVHLSVHYVTPISRQMVNVSYYLMQIATNCLMLCVLLWCQTMVNTIHTMNKKDDKETTKPSKIISTLYAAISRKQLLYFLIGNVLTGIVNKSVNTLNTDNETAVLVICLYMLTVNLSVSILAYLF